MYTFGSLKFWIAIITPARCCAGPCQAHRHLQDDPFQTLRDILGRKPPRRTRARRRNAPVPMISQAGWENSLQKTTPERLTRTQRHVRCALFASFINGLPTSAAFLKTNSNSSDEEELLAAKMMGRWRSGAPLALCPFHDDPELGADPQRNNAFMFEEDDKAGLKTPVPA